MKFPPYLFTIVAIGSLLSLVALALVPALGLLAPRAPELVNVDGVKSLELGDGNIRYQDVGSGSEALVFLHGFNAQLSTWNSVWPFVEGCGRAVRLDVAGYGASRWLTDDYSLQTQAERVIRFLDTLGLTRVTLVGVSMGGSLSAWIAAHYPDRVKGLVLLAPSGFPGSLHYHGLFGKLLGPGIANRLATQVAKSRLYRGVFPKSRALQALTVTASYGEPWARALERIRAHAWIIWSHGDAGVPFSFAETVAKAIPSSTLVPLAAAVGHDIPTNSAELVGKLACRVHQGAVPGQLPLELMRLTASANEQGASAQ